MAYGFLDIATTESVQAAQTAEGSRPFWADFAGHRAFDRFTANERDFIAARDSFYLASVLDNGWPYVQHRGGPAGFVQVLDDRTLGFADYRGNRQYISLGNIRGDGRVALIFVDYPRRHRLKLFARAEAKAWDADPTLTARIATPGARVHPERLFLLHLEAFDWNCPQHITPRYSTTEIAEREAPLRARIAELEAANAALVVRLDRLETD